MAANAESGHSAPGIGEFASREMFLIFFLFSPGVQSLGSAHGLCSSAAPTAGHSCAALRGVEFMGLGSHWGGFRIRICPGLGCSRWRHRSACPLCTPSSIGKSKSPSLVMSCHVLSCVVMSFPCHLWRLKEASCEAPSKVQRQLSAFVGHCRPPASIGVRRCLPWQRWCVSHSMQVTELMAMLA